MLINDSFVYLDHEVRNTSKYLTVACTVGPKYEKFAILRCFEKYAILKTIYLKIEQGILIFHITVEQNTTYAFKRVDMFLELAFRFLSIWCWNMRKLIILETSKMIYF